MTRGSFLIELGGLTNMSPKISDDQKEQRRKKILEAAKQVFIDKGYEPATLKDIV